MKGKVLKRLAASITAFAVAVSTLAVPASDGKIYTEAADITEQIYLDRGVTASFTTGSETYNYKFSSEAKGSYNFKISNITGELAYSSTSFPRVRVYSDSSLDSSKLMDDNIPDGGVYSSEFDESINIMQDVYVVLSETGTTPTQGSFDLTITKNSQSSSPSNGQDSDNSNNTSPSTPISSKINLATANITVDDANLLYNGSAQRPDVKINGTTYDYDDDDEVYLTYSNNINAGTAKVLVQASGSSSLFTGQKSVNFTIKRRSLGSSAASIYLSDYTYSGKVIYPAVYYYSKTGDGFGATLSRNRDFTSSGAKKAIGKHSYKITGKGNYTGSITKKYTIRPKAVKNLRKVKKTKKSMTVKWKKSKGVTGYCVEYYNAKKKKYVKKYTKSNTYTLKKQKGTYYLYAFVYAYKKVKGKKILSYSSYYYDYLKPSAKPKYTVRRDFGSIYVSFKNPGYYQIRYSFNDKNIKKNGIKKQYYFGSGTYFVFRSYYSSNSKVWFQVREYNRNRDGNLQFGPWSKKKKVKFP